jgi:hypothetical protein
VPLDIDCSLQAPALDTEIRSERWGTRYKMPPKLIASFLGREITFLASDLPAWMDEALGQTPYSTVKLREFFEQGKALPVAG